MKRAKCKQSAAAWRMERLVWSAMVDAALAFPGWPDCGAAVARRRPRAAIGGAK